MNRREKEIEIKKLQSEMDKLFPSEKLVFGEGNVNAKLAIIGEAPGRNEEKEGHPFVGKAGLILTSLLNENSIRRDKIWITNVVKWRPVEGSRNRVPSAVEVAGSSVFLKKELGIISPKIILCLGNTPAKVLIDRNFKMSEQHGEWFRSETGALATATFHPAFALRQSIRNRERILNAMRDDLNKVKLLYEFYLAK